MLSRDYRPLLAAPPPRGQVEAEAPGVLDEVGAHDTGCASGPAVAAAAASRTAASCLDDAGLMAITSCAQANVAQEAANVCKSMAALGKLIGLLNLFLAMVGGPEVPDLSDLAGTSLDEAIPPIDAIIETLQGVRDAVPVS